MKRAVIVVPTYNEVENVKKLIPQIFEEAKKNQNWEIHILIVDSHSNDGTEQAILKLINSYPKLHLLRMKKEGLGRAYIEGFKAALEKLNPYLLFEMDADLSHNPNDISRFLKEIERGADFVVGSRYIKGGSIPKDWGIHRKLFSILGNLIIRFGFMRLKNTEWTNGYRAIKSWIVKDAFDYIKNYSGYVFQVAFLDYALKNNARVIEIPVNFKDRKSGISKINTIQYITSSLLYVFLNSSFIKFVIVGSIGFTIDFGISYLGIERLEKPVWITTLIGTETAIISNFLLNNFWSFAHKKIGNNSRTFIFNFLKFNLVSSGAIIIQTIGMHLLDSFFGREWWYIYKVLIIIFIVVPYSYILYNKFIWKNK